MAVIAGYDGLVTFAGGYVTTIKAWTVNFSNTELDLTAFGDLWKIFIEGVSEWSGTYTGLIDNATFDPLSSINFQAAAAAATFVFDNSATDGSFNGNIILTGMDASNAVDGVPEVSFTFEGDGAAVITPAS